VRATTTTGVGLLVQAGSDAQGRRGVPVVVEGPSLPNGRYGEAMRIGGDVSIRGDLIVGGAKSALLDADGATARRAYCVEAAEAWLEDMGEADLEEGRAVVAIDPDLQPFLDVDRYQVTVTAYSPVSLYVARRDREAFEVRAVDEEAGGRFGWRLTARRADVEAPRLAPLEPVAFPDGGPPPPPRPPAPPPPAPSTMEGMESVEVWISPLQLSDFRFLLFAMANVSRPRAVRAREAGSGTAAIVKASSMLRV
jgi:hypothetical protein